MVVSLISSSFMHVLVWATVDKEFNRASNFLILFLFQIRMHALFACMCWNQGILFDY